MIRQVSRRIRCSLTVPSQFSRYLTTIGIRCEDPTRVWERRTPLTPQDVQALLSSYNDVAVEVESCKRRCFPDDKYHEVS
jgi:alpha-aminoadipic semialdehyde synthase